MSKGVFEIVAGAALIAVDVAFLGANPLLIEAGASLVAAGIGSLLTNQHKGIAANMLDPVAPWNVVYGQTRVGGTTIWQQTDGDTDKFWRRVIVLACHASQSVDALIFDNKRVCLDTNGNSLSFGGSTAVLATQQTQSITSITRVNNVVTVTMAGPMALPASTAAGPALMTGDTVQISNAPDNTLNGQFQILMQSDTVFTYISGGNPVSGSGGQVKTQWPDYGDTVHFEVALGTQNVNNPPFPSLITDSGGTWTANHLAQGRTVVYLRMKYGGNTYQPGIPTIGFLLHGKNDIYDPRSGNNLYTENAALCTADFLAQQTWGYKLLYGTDIPTSPLISAANICDEQVQRADGSFESRYTCNGGFQLNAGRGEILQNLLTACGGRLTCSGGQYVISPAAWVGATVQVGNAIPTNANGSPLASAVLVVYASYTQGSSGVGSPVIAGVYGGFTNGGLLSTGPAVNTLVENFPIAVNTSALGNRLTQLTYNVSTADFYRVPQLNLVFCIQGTLTSSDNAPGTTLNIYDVYLNVTFQDGTTGTVRPAAFTTRQEGGAGTVTNPQSAVDTDTNPPTTFASINRTVYGGLAQMGYLAVSNFFFPTSNNVVPTAVTLEYAAGPFVWRPKLPIRELYNGVKGTYVSPVNNWQSSDFPPYAQDTDHGYAAPAGSTGYYDVNLAADGGDRRWYDIQLPFTNSYSMAQRLAKVELLRKREQGSGTFAFNLAMYQLTALDVISMTVPYLPTFSNKLLEVTNHRFTVANHEDGDSRLISLGTELDLNETDSSVYAWSPTEELSPEGYAQSTFEGTQIIQSPSGVTLTSGNSVAVVSGGIAQSRVQIQWTLPTDGFIVNGGYTVVQYQIVGQSGWTALGNFDPSTTMAYINGVSDGTQYFVRIAFVNAAGVQSPWTVVGPITASGPQSANNYAYNEIPTGPYDGVGTVYGLQFAPDPTESLQLYYNGYLLTQGLDYTLDGQTITFLTYIPNRNSSVAGVSTGDVLRAFYHYASTSVAGGAGAGTGTGTGTGGTGTGGTGGTGTGGAGTSPITVNGGPGSQMSFTGAQIINFADGLNSTNISPGVWDNNGNLIGYTSAEVIDGNNTTLTFANPQSGTVKLTPTVYQQSFTNATSVSIPHNLNSLNIIPTVFDTNRNVIGYGTFTLNDSNNATLTFANPQSGSIQIIDPTNAYSQSFSSVTSVSVTHNLNTTLVRAAVYNSSNVLIGFSTFGPVSANTSTLTFANPQSGRVVVIDPASGAASSSGSSASVASQIYGDMTGSNEEQPHGVPTSGGSGFSNNGPGLVDGNNLGSNTAIEAWGGLYVGTTGNPATNTRVALKNFQLWWLRASTGVWTQSTDLMSSLDGGYYSEDFTTDFGTSVTFTPQSDGSVAFTTTSGKVAHFFSPFPRMGVDNTDFGGVVVVADMQLVLINPSGTDDRSTANFVCAVGADPYPATTGSGIENNPGLGISKFKKLTSTWRSICFTTLTQAAITANPPPIDLTGISA